MNHDALRAFFARARPLAGRPISDATAARIADRMSRFHFVRAPHWDLARFGWLELPIWPLPGIHYDSVQESFTARYTHETVALGFSITEEAMESHDQ